MTEKVVIIEIPKFHIQMLFRSMIDVTPMAEWSNALRIDSSMSIFSGISYLILNSHLLNLVEEIVLAACRYLARDCRTGHTGKAETSPRRNVTKT